MVLRLRQTMALAVAGLLLCCGAVARQVSVSAVSGVAGTQVQVPVLLDAADGVLGICLRITYPADLAIYRDCQRGSLLATWADPVVDPTTAGQLVLTAAGTQPLAGAGSLVVIEFGLQHAGPGLITVAAVELNDGAVPADSAPAVPFTVSAAPWRQFSISPASGVVGSQLSVPVAVDDAAAMLGFAFQFGFPGGLARYAGFERGSLTATWPDPAISADPGGQLTVVCAGAEPLVGAGNVVVLKFDLLAVGTGTLSLTAVQVNDGTIGAAAGPDVTFEVTTALARQLEVDPVHGQVGARVAVPVSVAAATDVLGVALRLRYPQGLATYGGCERGSLTADWPDAVVNATAPGELTILIAGTQALSGSGSVVVLSFDLTASGSGLLSVAEASLNDGTIPVGIPSAAAFEVTAVPPRQLGLMPVLGTVGSVVSVPVLIDEAADVMGFAVRVEYPADLAAVVGVEPGSLSGAWGAPVVNTGTPGQVTVVNAGSTPLSGAGSLFALHLQLNQAGSGQVSLAGVELNDGLLSANGTTDVSFVVVSAPARQLSVRPVAVSLNRRCTVPVLLDNATGVVGYAFRLRYPATLLAYSAAEPGDLTVSWGTPIVNQVQPGELVVVAAGNQPLSGAGSLVSLQFDPLQVGGGVVSLTEVELNDGGIPAQGVDNVPCRVTALEQTIRFGPLPDRVYGDAAFNLTASGTSDLTVAFTSLTPTVVEVSGNTARILAAGPATIRASQDGDANWAPAPAVDCSFTVGKAMLTVTAVDTRRRRGDPNPAFALSYAGFAYGDTTAALDHLPVGVCSATADSAPGTYPVVPADGTDDSYQFTYVPGTLTVEDWLRFSLVGGWNLLSLPCELGAGTELSQLLVTDDGHSLATGSVFGWDNRRERFSPFTVVPPATQGFWVWCSQSGSTRVLSGTVPNPTATLEYGWNLIGVAAEITMADMLGRGQPLGAVWWWDPAGVRYRAVQPDARLLPGVGYWVYATGTMVIRVR